MRGTVEGEHEGLRLFERRAAQALEHGEVAAGGEGAVCAE